MSEPPEKRIIVGSGELHASSAAVTGSGISSAVSSVNSVAPYVVSDFLTAMAIRDTVCSLDAHDLTAVKNEVFPSHVPIPENEDSRNLARSYAEAELTDRATKSSWRKSGIGWAVLVACTVIAGAVGAWLG